MNQFREAMAPPPDIATRAELDQRLAARVRPQPERHPSPSPHERLEALRATETANEERIVELTNTLSAANVKLDHNYAFASLKGRSRAHFEQVR